MQVAGSMVEAGSMEAEVEGNRVERQSTNLYGRTAFGLGSERRSPLPLQTYGEDDHAQCD